LGEDALDRLNRTSFEQFTHSIGAIESILDDSKLSHEANLPEKTSFAEFCQNVNLAHLSNTFGYLSNRLRIINDSDSDSQSLGKEFFVDTGAQIVMFQVLLKARAILYLKI
jgi:hypothetical protein